MLHCDAVLATQTPLRSLSCNRTSQVLSPLHKQRASLRRVSRPCSLKTKAIDQQTQESVTPPPDTGSGEPDRRAVLAGAAVLLGTGGVLATRAGKGAPSFASLQKGSVDLDVALANGKPTIIEFYAAW